MRAVKSKQNLYKKITIQKKSYGSCKFFYSFSHLIDGGIHLASPFKSTEREERKGREGVFHGSFDQKDRCDDYSGVGVAGRVVRLDYAYGDDAIIPTFTHRHAQQSCHSVVLPAASA